MMTRARLLTILLMLSAGGGVLGSSGTLAAVAPVDGAETTLLKLLNVGGPYALIFALLFAVKYLAAKDNAHHIEFEKLSGELVKLLSTTIQNNTEALVRSEAASAHNEQAFRETSALLREMRLLMDHGRPPRDPPLGS